MTRLPLSFAIATLTVTGACSSGTSIVAGAPDAPVETASGNEVPRPELAITDADRTKPSSCADSWLAGSTGRVVDDLGHSIVGARVAYCAYGAAGGVCLPWVETTSGGWYSILVDPPHRCMTRLSVRVIPQDASARLSEAYCVPSLAASKRGVLDLATDLRVYSLRAPTALPPRGDTAKARTVTFEGGLSITFAPDDLVEGEGYEKLSAGPLPDGERPCFLAPDVTIDALYAFSPAMNVSLFADKPKVRFELPNPKSLPNGTAVAIYALGGSGSQLDVDHVIEEGSFVVIGDGHVANGRIVPDPGSELPVLTVVGYRTK